MIFEATIPGWAAERHLYLIAGNEVAAYRMYGDDTVYVKTVRCQSCGWCCENIRPAPCPRVVFKDGERSCALGMDRPWACTYGDPVMCRAKDAETHCAVRYAKQ